MHAPIEKTYFFPFPTHVVYRAWVSSDTVIPPATAMDILPEVGGHYRLFIQNDDFSTRAQGVFLIVLENRHLVYTWKWQDSSEESQIDVKFLQVDGGCQIILEHSGFDSRESLWNHDQGWDNYTEAFALFLKSSPRKS